MNSTITPYSVKLSGEKNYDDFSNKMYLQPKTNTISNKITYRPSHVPISYSPSNTTPKQRPQYAGPLLQGTQAHRIYNGGAIQPNQFNTQPLNGPRLYTNGNSGSSRGSIASRGTPATSSLSERSGPAFGKYKLIREIGKGNFAKVKLAQHLVTGKEVAVKIIDKTKLNSSALQKLTREVKVMKELNHPNIVRLYEVIQTERSLYLVMEYAPNGEVFEHLVKNGRLKEKDARAKFRQILSAVQYCHQKMIVHRDLKAENLLLDKDMCIKIADFGFSNHYSPQSKLNTFCGSPPYAAPELFQGRRYEGPEVDVWSLGVIMYTLISGSLPFDGGTLKELRERVLRGKYRIPFYMSSNSEALLRKMLVLNPSKRLPLHEIMKDLWVNMGYEDTMLQPYVEPEIDYNDQLKIDALLNMGFTRQQIMETLLQKRYDSITAIYLLWDNSVPKPSAKPALLMSTYGNCRTQAPNSVPISTTVPEISAITKNQYADDSQRSTSFNSRTTSAKFTRKTSVHTVASSANAESATTKDGDKHSSPGCNNGSPGNDVSIAYDFTQTSNHRYPIDNVPKKPRPQPLRNVIASAYSDVKGTGRPTEMANKSKSDVDVTDVITSDKFSDAADVTRCAVEKILDEDQFPSTDGSSSNKLIETNIDDVEVPKVSPFTGSTVSNNSTVKVRRNQKVTDNLSTKSSVNNPAKKGHADQDGDVYNSLATTQTDMSKINTGFNNSPHNSSINNNPSLNLAFAGLDQDSYTGVTHQHPRLPRSNTCNPRPTNNTFKQLSVPEPMSRLVEEPDNDSDIDLKPSEPTGTFQRSVNGYQSLRLPDMIPPYQAYTGIQSFSISHKKEEPREISSFREQSPFSRNTPERATIQVVPHNTRGRIELETAVLSGVGGPSGPSNLPTALGGSINHPQPPKKDRVSNQQKKSSQEYLAEQTVGTKSKKKGGMNSFFRSLTTKITKKKLSNASPIMERSPSQNESSYHGSIQRSHTNQFRYIDNNDKWPNYPADASPSPSPYFQDRSNRQGYTNKASHYDTENLITSSCATSLTSSASSLATHGNRAQTKPRTLRFSFRTEATSKKGADELIADIKRVLVAFHIDYEQKSGFLLLCTYGENTEEAVILWEIEVVKLSTKSINGIRFKRLHGPQLKFKEISKKITERLQL